MRRVRNWRGREYEEEKENEQEAETYKQNQVGHVVREGCGEGEGEGGMGGGERSIYEGGGAERGDTEPSRAADSNTNLMTDMSIHAGGASWNADPTRDE